MGQSIANCGRATLEQAPRRRLERDSSAPWPKLGTIPVHESGSPHERNAPMTSSTSGRSPAPRTDSGFGGFDAQEMAIVHRALRRELRLLGEMITAVPPGT